LGVEDVFQQLATEVLYKGEPIRLSAISPEVWARRVGFDLVERSGSDAEMVAALRGGGVFIYDAFQSRFGVRIGQSVLLPTPKGPHEFPVVGVRRMLSTNANGGIQMDLATFDRFWTRSGVSNLVVWTSGDQDEVLERLRKGSDDSHALFTVDGRTLATAMRSDLDQYNGPVRGLVLLILVVAGTAVFNLMLSVTHERQADIALLRCVGASRRQLVTLSVLGSGMVGGAGVVAGLLLGGSWAVPLSGILTEQLGWKIQWNVRLLELAILSIGTLLASVAIGMALGLRLGRGASWNSLSPE